MCPYCGRPPTDGGGATRAHIFTEGKLTSPTTKTDWYGVTKRIAEEHVKVSDGSWSIVRVSFPYVSHFEGKEDFVRRIMRLSRWAH